MAAAPNKTLVPTTFTFFASTKSYSTFSRFNDFCRESERGAVEDKQWLNTIHQLHKDMAERRNDITDLAIERNRVIDDARFEYYAAVDALKIDGIDFAAQSVIAAAAHKRLQALKDAPPGEKYLALKDQQDIDRDKVAFLTRRREENKEKTKSAFSDIQFAAYHYVSRLSKAVLEPLDAAGHDKKEYTVSLSVVDVGCPHFDHLFFSVPKHNEFALAFFNEFQKIKGVKDWPDDVWRRVILLLSQQTSCTSMIALSLMIGSIEKSTTHEFDFIGAAPKGDTESAEEEVSSAESDGE